MKLGFTPIEYGDCITVEWMDSHGCHHLGILDGSSAIFLQELPKKISTIIIYPNRFFG